MAYKWRKEQISVHYCIMGYSELDKKSFLSAPGVSIWYCLEVFFVVVEQGSIS